jgi:hypothetical protein
MWKTFAPMLGGLALSLPVLAADRPANTSGKTADYLKKTTHVELRGKLEFVQRRPWLEERLVPLDEATPVPAALRLGHWQLTVNGQTYRLDLGAAKNLYAQADKLKGKVVVVTGTVEEYMSHRSPRADRMDCVPDILYLPLRVKMVHVTSLQPFQLDSARETVTVEGRGKLEFQGGFLPEGRIGIRFNPWRGYVVTIAGKQYRLDFSANAKAELTASRLCGKNVVLTGRLETRQDFSGCVPTPQDYIVVTDLRSAS